MGHIAVRSSHHQVQVSCSDMDFSASVRQVELSRVVLGYPLLEVPFLLVEGLVGSVVALQARPPIEPRLAINVVDQIIMPEIARPRQ